MCGGKEGESQNEANKPILSVSLRTPFQAISQVQLLAFFTFYIELFLFGTWCHSGFRVMFLILRAFYEFDVCKLIDFIIADAQSQQQVVSSHFLSLLKNSPLLTKIILFGVWEPHTKLPLFRQEYTVLALASHH